MPTYTESGNLSEAFFNSLQYFLKSDTDIDVDTVRIAHSDLDISSLIPPFIIIRPWDWRQSEFVMPDDVRLAEEFFDIWVSCESFGQQRALSKTVIRKLDSETAIDDDAVTRPGIQVYTGWDLSTTGGGPDTDTKICAAELELSAARPFEITLPEEKNRKYMDIISGRWEKVKEKDQKFITST